jgi:hypothetical protein
MPGFYLDAPTSLWSSAYDKAHRTRSTAYALPVSKSKAKPALLAKLKSLGKSDKASSPVVHSSSSVSPWPCVRRSMAMLLARTNYCICCSDIDLRLRGGKSPIAGAARVGEPKIVF